MSQHDTQIARFWQFIFTGAVEQSGHAIRMRSIRATSLGIREVPKSTAGGWEAASPARSSQQNRGKTRKMSRAVRAVWRNATNRYNGGGSTGQSWLRKGHNEEVAMHDRVVAVILAGGKGSRLEPLTRAAAAGVGIG